jgi:23S rRNA (guanine2445-N2)-methyltransferase / 23S rRNA (guanine2069-N7)-methyltransferase
MEGLLQAEVTELGATATKLSLAGLYASGTLEVAYRICLWSRLANRLLCILAQQPVTSVAMLYDAVMDIEWLEHIAPECTLWIDFAGECEGITHSNFGAQKVKDAIVDHVRERTGLRPNIEKEQPDIRINVFLFKGIATISLDLSGESLHRRGYRIDAGVAPLKENLAAAILVRAGWPQYMHSPEATFIDPMCGSGTLLIEAAMMAADIAPGLLRSYFGFRAWKHHQPELWATLRKDAIARKEVGLAKELPDIRGYDADPRVLGHAKANIERAQLDEVISVSVKELAKLVRPTHKSQAPGLLVTNPPYGERMSDMATLQHLYHYLGQKLREEFPDWQAAIFTGNSQLGKTMGIRARKKYAFFNGTIPCDLLLFTITPEWFVTDKPAAVIETEPAPQTELTSGATMVANRIKKNIQKLERWLKTANTDCYRVYDADIPEYAVAVDKYKGYFHVQEYAAPKTIDAEKAAQRLQESVTAVKQVFQADTKKVIVKQRLKQKGKNQYEKLAQHKHYFEVNEEGAKLLINLTDYLDTGVFLDHRPVRRMIKQMVKGKTFLNLFCYTATATVHAGIGGAKRSTSVDMSATYTDWARSNFALNGLSESLHKVVQADCLTWLQDNTQTFDLILLDPPTFSNSKRMQDILDIQRDHVNIITLCMRSLNKDGTLIFSNNFRKFKLDADNLSHYHVEDITAKTFDPDFSRDLKLHHCWLIRHKHADANS